MAEDHITTLSKNEIVQLAARLLARADSKLIADQPQQAHDLRLAVRVLLVKIGEMGNDTKLEVG
jgi:hypothetical protein